MAAPSDMKAIKEWVSKQPHLPQNLEECLLLTFLQCCDNSLDRAKTCMELFFTLRFDNPEVFSSRDPTSKGIQHTFGLMELCPLTQQLTPDRNACFFFRFSDPDPDKFNFFDFVKTFFMVADTAILTEAEVVTGIIPILDMTGWTLKHIMKVPITTIRKYLIYCQEAHPVKLKQIHVINVVPIFDKLLALIRPFLNNEVASVIHTHTPNSDTLFKFVPKEILPNEYGGKAGPVKELAGSWKKRVEGQRDWFLKNEWVSDESKRIGKRTVKPQMDEGSFRTLSVD